MFDACAPRVGQRLAARGRSLEGRVTAKQGWTLGDGRRDNSHSLGGVGDNEDSLVSP
jgi:hypothetical protein